MVVVFKPIGRVEDVITEKFPGGAVDAVGARLDRRVQNSTRSSAKLGAKVSGLDLEFRDRVQRGKHDKVRAVQEVDGIRVVIDAIQQVVVLRCFETIGAESAGGRIASGVRLRAVHARA